MLVAQGRRTHEIPIAFNKWHHVTGVCDGQRVGLFIDGKLVSVRSSGGGLKAKQYADDHWQVYRRARWPQPETGAGGTAV